jgi:hypothetical protein
MTPRLTAEGYAHTQVKLADMEARLAALQLRDDLSPTHRAEAERSYIDMIRQYKREIKMYEMYHREGGPNAEGDGALTSDSLASRIVDALVDGGIVDKREYRRAVGIVAEEIGDMGREKARQG